MPDTADPRVGSKRLRLASTAKTSASIYLSVDEIVAYGIVLRDPGQPKATVAEVVECINRLGLQYYAIRDGKLVYDPVPIRKALSTITSMTGRSRGSARGRAS